MTSSFEPIKVKDCTHLDLKDFKLVKNADGLEFYLEGKLVWVVFLPESVKLRAVHDDTYFWTEFVLPGTVLKIKYYI